MKKAPRNPATSEEVIVSLDAVRNAEKILSNAKAELKKARESVRKSRIELSRRKRLSKRAFKSALNRKPLR